MTTYIGLLKPGPSETCTVLFPDFPDLRIARVPFDEIQEIAKHRLAGHIEKLRIRGEPIPFPTRREEIESAHRKEAILVCVDVRLETGLPSRSLREACLADVLDHGAILVLDDGSKWQVEPECLPRSARWSPAEHIRVFDRELWNLTRGEQVQAVRLK